MNNNNYIIIINMNISWYLINYNENLVMGIYPRFYIIINQSTCLSYYKNEQLLNIKKIN